MPAIYSESDNNWSHRKIYNILLLPAAGRATKLKAPKASRDSARHQGRDRWCDDTATGRAHDVVIALLSSHSTFTRPYPPTSREMEQQRCMRCERKLDF